MPGTQETIVYEGSEGKVYRQDMLSGTQYHARTSINGKSKARYYGSKNGAINWLKKVKGVK